MEFLFLGLTLIKPFAKNNKPIVISLVASERSEIVVFNNKKHNYEDLYSSGDIVELYSTYVDFY